MKIRNASSRWQAMTLVEVLVVVVVLFVLGLLLLPTACGCAKQKSQRITCINNLKQIGTALRIWQNDNSDFNPWEVSVTNGGAKELSFGPLAFTNFAVMQNELGQAAKVVLCPEDKARTFATNFIYFGNTNVSYFLGVTVHAYGNPDLFLVGDRNLLGTSPRDNGIYNLLPNDRLTWAGGLHSTRFHPAGNILFSDGRGMPMSDEDLQVALRKPGVAPNVLAFP